MTPRAYQDEACAAIEAAWDTGGKAPLLVMATGLGKTRVFCHVLQRRRHLGRALVLVHREELLQQARDAIRRDTGLTVEIERGEDRATVASMWPSDVVVASVPTLHKRRRMRWPHDAFATVVIDEAHHSTARTYREIIAHFNTARVLGVTATPDRGDETGLAAVFDTVAYRYEIREAITDGWLCPITQKSIHCADLDVSAVRSVRGDLSEGDLQRALTIDSVLHQIAGPLVKEAGARPTLVFTAGVEQAHALAEVLSGYTKSGVEAIDASTPRLQRADILARYKAGEVQYLCNVSVLTEGFDAPHTACIAMARPTKSRALYAQIIGRGTRKADGKADCLVLDFVGNAGRHKLVTPLDALAGKPLPEPVRKRARALAEKGMPLTEALAKAETEQARKEEKAAQRKARAHVQAKVEYRGKVVCPFGALGIATGGEGPRASEEQLAYLKRMGVPVEQLPTPSRREASQLIGRMVERRRRGQCTYKQSVVLARAGLRDDLSFADAKVALDALAGNRWRVTPELAQRFGRNSVEVAV